MKIDKITYNGKKLEIEKDYIVTLLMPDFVAIEFNEPILCKGKNIKVLTLSR